MLFDHTWSKTVFQILNKGLLMVKQTIQVKTDFF